MDNISQSLPINLVIKDIHAIDYPKDLADFLVPISVTIGDKNDAHGGGEVFYFTVASPQGLNREQLRGAGFQFLRGYILMNEFDMNKVHLAIDRLISHARSRTTWREIVSFFNRYGLYESEDLDGKHIP